MTRKTKQSKLTKAARGQTCTIQIYPWCCNDPDTVVFCHAPSEAKGMAIKSPDFWGADGCRVCHDICDGRLKVDLDDNEIYRCFMRGVFRTIRRRIDQGLIILA